MAQVQDPQIDWRVDEFHMPGWSFRRCFGSQGEIGRGCIRQLKTLGGWGARGAGVLVGNASPHPRMRSSAHIAGMGFFALVYLHHRVFGIQRDGGQSSQDSGAAYDFPLAQGEKKRTTKLHFLKGSPWF